jgi:ATP/maltotriose-dependent transcriptional regulator MalT
MSTAHRPGTLEHGRAAFDRREWTAAARSLLAADRARPLDATDLGHAGLASYLIGDEDTASAVLARAHQAAAAAGDAQQAAMIAYWIGAMTAERGDAAVAGGWFARASRLIETEGSDSVVHGYLLVAEAVRSLAAGDAASALTRFEAAAAAADRFDEVDLATLARVGRGRCLIVLGEIDRGVALLDDAMLAVTSGEVGPVVVGIAYCSAIEAFREIYDLQRGQGWTDALTRWCAQQPDLVPFRGACLVYRADLMRLHGAWDEATAESRRAKELLLRPPPAAQAGDACYVEAELHRLRGDHAAAEAAYRDAAGWGRRTEPGLALLRVAQGRPDPALVMIQRAIDETPDGLLRAPLLDALVEISLAAGDEDGARRAADELTGLATLTEAPLLEAIATRADGLVRLAADDGKRALVALRRSFSLWQSLDAPHDLARVRVGIARACRSLGDEETAALELAAARRVFAGLGAAPDVAAVDAIAGAMPPAPGGLSGREVEVLRHLAGGLTNRGIAETLGISERTVDRHVSNIYTKLDVSSRAAATAFAYEHRLV